MDGLDVADDIDMSLLPLEADAEAAESTVDDAEAVSGPTGVAEAPVAEGAPDEA